MTLDKAVQELTNHWASCQDALGLCLALQAIGAVKFDPEDRQKLIERAHLHKPGDHGSYLLIKEMAAELERTL